MKHLPIEEWEQLLKQGRGQEVKALIKDLNLSRVPRDQAASLANLSHRLNLPHVALRVLNPIVRQSGKSLAPANENELAEYSIGLTRVGVFEEARQILEQLNAEHNPKVLLYRAFVQMSQWHYQLAVPLLRSYISRAEKDPYQKTVAQVNLAACLVFLEEVSSAETLLTEILKHSKAAKFSVLFGNANELMGQVALLQNEFKRAEEFLSQGQEALKGSHSIGSFFIEKWQTISQIRQNSWNETSRFQLEKLRTRARELKHWETLRDCDYVEALLTEDPQLVQHLYFGTPYKEYRQRLKKKFGFHPSWKATYHRQLGSKEKGAVLDVTAGILEGTSLKLNPGQIPHQLLFILAKDFYRPFRLGALFSALHPGEYFDPETSYDRVHKSMNRLRDWFRQNQLPLGISENAGFYELTATGAIQLKLDLRLQLPEPEKIHLQLLRTAFQRQNFTAAQAAQFLELSPSSVHLILKQLADQGSIEKKGAGPSTTYFLKAG